MGAATPNLAGGYLFRFDLTGNRAKIGVDDPRLQDRVADNLAKHDITESESLLIGENFGVVTDIETGPNGNLYVRLALQRDDLRDFRSIKRSGAGTIARVAIRQADGGYVGRQENLPTRGHKAAQRTGSSEETGTSRSE